MLNEKLGMNKGRKKGIIIEIKEKKGKKDLRKATNKDLQNDFVHLSFEGNEGGMQFHMHY